MPELVIKVPVVRIWNNLVMKRLEQNRTEHNFIDIKLRPLTGSVRARYKNKAYT